MLYKNNSFKSKIFNSRKRKFNKQIKVLSVTDPEDGLEYYEEKKYAYGIYEYNEHKDWKNSQIRHKKNTSSKSSHTGFFYKNYRSI